jgi:hypothetical protein
MASHLVAGSQRPPPCVGCRLACASARSAPAPMCEMVRLSSSNGDNPACLQAPPLAATLLQACGDPRALLPPKAHSRLSRLPPVERFKKENVGSISSPTTASKPTMIPGLALSAPSALEGAVCGLQPPLTAVPPGPPAASRSPDGQPCDSAVVFEGLGSLSLLLLPRAGLSLRCPFLLVRDCLAV